MSALHALLRRIGSEWSLLHAGFGSAVNFRQFPQSLASRGCKGSTAGILGIEPAYFLVLFARAEKVQI